MDGDHVLIAFAHKRQRRNIASGLVPVVYLGLMAWGGMGGNGWVVSTVALVSLVSFAGFIWRDWRCPVCDRALGRENTYTYCPHCASRLTP